MLLRRPPVRGCRRFSNLIKSVVLPRSLTETGWYLPRRIAEKTVFIASSNLERWPIRSYLSLSVPQRIEYGSVCVS